MNRVPAAVSAQVGFLPTDLDIPAFVAIVEALPDGLVIVDVEGRIMFVNQQVEALFGHERTALLHAPIEVLLPVALRELHEKYRSRYVDLPTIRSMGSGLELVGRHRDGHDVPVEVSLSPICTADGSLRVLAAIRDVTDQAHARHDRERNTQLWETVAAFTTELLAAATSNPFDVVAKHAQALLHGEAAAVFTLEGDALLRTEGFSGASLGTQNSPHSALDQLFRNVIIHQTAVVLDLRDFAVDGGGGQDASDAPFASIVCAQITSNNTDKAIVVARRDSSSAFHEENREDLSRFASQVNLALELAKRRANERRIAIVEDRERIARDLHDRVIGRLFATGLGLHTIASSSADREMVSRAEQAIDDIDRSIADLRHAIFALSHTDSETIDIAEVERLITRTMKEKHDHLGFAPKLVIVRSNARISITVTAELVSTLSESLANVARHANATAVDVQLNATSNALTLSVLDNGRGIAHDHVPGNGLQNMNTRAGSLHGHCRVEPGPTGGTLVTWTVPLHAP